MDCSKERFHYFFQGEFNNAFEKIKNAVDSLENISVCVEELQYILENSLILEIDQLLLPPFAAELYKKKKDGLLLGNCSHQRYLYFFHESRDFLNHRSYPVLYDSAKLLIDTAAENMIWILSRINQDFQILCRWTNTPLSHKVSLKLLDSDRHAGGQQVAQVNFGECYSLIYKPVPVDIDVLFGYYLKILNLPSPFDLKAMKALPMDGYGWLEYICYKECYSEKDVQDFYRRSGALIAVVDSLNYCDGHYGNLIAQGSYPMLIDCETLFHMFHSNDSEVGVRSILFTGLIQRRRDADGGRGMSGAFQVRGSRKKAYFDTHPINDGTDNLQVRYRRDVERLSHNSPIFNSMMYTGGSYINEVIEGFRFTYDYISNISQEILMERMFFESVKTIRVRQVVRHTMYYFYLMRNIQQPKYSKNKELICEYLYEKLFDDQIENKKRMTSYEISDILKLDIPYFYHYPEKTSYYDHLGVEYTGSFEQSSLEDVVNRLQNRSIQYRDAQIALIRDHLPYSQEPLSLYSLDESIQKELTNLGIQLGRENANI